MRAVAIVTVVAAVTAVNVVAAVTDQDNILNLNKTLQFEISVQQSRKT